ncbi:MAG: hypothetical protein HY396_00840 [Candidatus Doudnabacteria bacterium]|nr:hypothetical protein [Candidatus Doudnabacteria bacterium]
MKNMMPMMILMSVIVIVAFGYALSGLGMHRQVAVEEAKFHQLQDSYFSQSKAIRDAAETNSQLNKDLAQIQNYPSELLRLKLVGVGKILTGIFALLFGILLALVSMPMRLGKILKQPVNH